MKILQLTAHFSPNIGGVETHLNDLIQGLQNEHIQTFVLTYRPLSTKANWSIWKSDKGTKILRLPWIPGLFNKLSRIPAGEFLYLVPGLFITLPFILLYFRPEVIHAHGLSAGFIAAIWGKVFKIRTVISTHSIYHFPKNGMYRKIALWIFSTISRTLCLSNQSVQELVDLGVPANRVGRFTYWVDLNKFSPHSKSLAKKQLNWSERFIVLFVGRLVPEKGIPELISAVESFDPHVSLKIAGSGPMASELGGHYIGKISQEALPIYYSAADLVIVPSTHDEGFGRVILESMACGTPVVASNRGAIPEAMNENVGHLITITSTAIAKTINHYYQHPNLLANLAKNTRPFAKKHYSSSNIKSIISAYYE